MVVEANCIRQLVSLLFPHLGIRRRENNKETSSLAVLASDTNTSHATMATTLVQTTNLFLVCTHPTAMTSLEFLSEMKLFATVRTAGSIT